MGTKSLGTRLTHPYLHTHAQPCTHSPSFLHTLIFIPTHTHLHPHTHSPSHHSPSPPHTLTFIPTHTHLHPHTHSPSSPHTLTFTPLTLHPHTHSAFTPLTIHPHTHSAFTPLTPHPLTHSTLHTRISHLPPTHLTPHSPTPPSRETGSRWLVLFAVSPPSALATHLAHSGPSSWPAMSLSSARRLLHCSLQGMLQRSNDSVKTLVTTPLSSWQNPWHRPSTDMNTSKRLFSACCWVVWRKFWRTEQGFVGKLRDVKESRPHKNG